MSSIFGCVKVYSPTLVIANQSSTQLWLLVTSGNLFWLIFTDGQLRENYRFSIRERDGRE